MSFAIYSVFACKAIESHLLWQDVEKRLEALIEYCYHAGAAEK
jgi:hypothetical protein